MSEETSDDLETKSSRLALTTARSGLSLCDLTVSDIDDYYLLVDQNREHLGQHGDFSFERSATRDQIAANLSSAADDSLRFGLWLHGELIGRVDLNPVDPPRYVLGFWIASRHTGRGFMTAACVSAIDHARSLGATEIYAGVTVGNDASVRVLKRLRFDHIQSLPDRTRWRLSLVPNPPAPVMATS